MIARALVASIAALLIAAPIANAGPSASAADKAAVRLFEAKSPSKMRHSHTSCRRRTTQIYWRCSSSIQGTKGYTGKVKTRVHRKTLRVRVRSWQICWAGGAQCKGRG